MSGFSKFVVAGAGGLGAHIVKQLAAQPNTSVTVFTRKDSTPKDLPSNVKAVAVDYSNEAELEAALKGQEVVISTLSGGGFAAQPALARASKAAGIKHFIPSEFGSDTIHVTEGILYGKTQFQALLDTLQLPYSVVINGPFPEFCLIPPAGFDFPNNTINHIHPGTAPISWTTMEDVARFLAHYLTHTTSPERILRLEGDRTTFVEISNAYKKVHPDVKYSTTPEEVYRARLEKDPGDIFAYLLTHWNEGTSGTVGEANGTKLWPEWKPKTVKQVLGL